LSRARITILFVALLALATTFAACGDSDSGSDDPQAVADEATLKGVESGEVDLALTVGVEGEKRGRVEVSLSGPFQTEDEEQLPELDMTATAKGAVGGEKVDFEGGLVLLGEKAFVNYEGTEYEVDSTTFNFVRSIFRQQGRGQDRSSEATACQEAFTELKLGEFIENPSETTDAEVGGTSTTRVSGELDAVGAVDALTELSEDPACSQQLEATGQLPSASELDEAKSTFQDSLESAHVELYVGDDDIVRRMVAEATIEPPEGAASGGAKKVDVDIDLTLTEVNEEQTIAPPPSSKPLSELFIKLGINPLELVDLLEGNGGLSPGGLNGLLEGLGSGGAQ
jgi:hypothetical protein